MDQTKPWYASKAVWGGLVAVAAPVASYALHVTIGAGDQATLVDALAGIGSGVGGLLAVYGRVTATRAIAPVTPAAISPGSSCWIPIALALAFACMAAPALAQEPRVPVGQKGTAARAVPGVIPGTVVPCDPANLIPGCRNADGTINPAGGPANPLANLTDEVLAKLLADFTYAAARAHATNNTVTAPCWDTWVKLLTAQSQPLSDGKGTALTKPDPHAITDAELASELINQLQPNSDLSIACAPTLQASQRNISTLVGAVLSGGALGLFKLP